MRHARIAGLLLAAAAASPGCAGTPKEEDPAAHFIAEMDAMPPKERVPHWEETRALMERPAPAVGDVAPDFELPAEDGSGRVRLSDLWSEQPVVLIFGSYT